MLSKNHPIILFIDRNGFSVYQDNLSNIAKFNFTPDLVSNLDVINKEQFVSLIATFIQINKIVPSSLAVILSDNAIYVKDLVIPVKKPAPAQNLKADLNSDKEYRNEVQNFLENIPFEEILAKVIKMANVNRIVAVNKDLVAAITNAFTSKGSVAEAIIPSFMYGQEANFTAGLTLNNVRVILGNAEALRLGNLLIDQERLVPYQNLESESKDLPSGGRPDLANRAKKPRKLREYLLIGVFVILLIILAVVYLNMKSSEVTSQNLKAKHIPVNALNPSLVPPAASDSLPDGGTASAQNLITAAPMNFKSIKIKITQSSQADEKAVNLRNELLKIGFEDIVSQVSESLTPEKSSAIFSQNIPADLKNEIITKIRKILPEISILENQDSDFTIDILIGKS